MSKKVYKFFGGAMKSQEKWLNKMSDSGYRLIKTGKAHYEFEKCEPSQYRYAVEFVGHKPAQGAEDYKNFLEDCGYNVFYKNINLDYSIAKAEIRPWADKGGRIATTKGAVYKELLIVEKENDGRPFELHTSEEDIAEYRKTLQKPWYFLFLTLLTAALIAAASIAIPAATGYKGERSSMRKGYIGSSGRSNWSGRYSLLDGNMKKTLYSADRTLDIAVETKSGNISIEIYDNGELIWNEKDIGTDSFTVEIPDEKAVVRILSSDHKGSFDIKG